MNRIDRFSEEELELRRTKNYELITDMAAKLQNLKGYETGYSNPNKGKMIVNFNGQNYLVDIEPILVGGDNTIENVMNKYKHVFKD